MSKFRYESRSGEVKKRLKDREQEVLGVMGVYVEGEATLRAPVDTGNLRSSLNHRVGDREVTIGTPVEYAPAVEQGTSTRREKPYLRPAVEQNRGNLARLAQEVFSKL